MFLTYSDQSTNPLHRYLDLHCNFDYTNWILSFNKIFQEVIVYDQAKNFIEKGSDATQDEIIEIIRRERPKYLIWPSMSYEISEITFQKARDLGVATIGFFFDDATRFDEYSIHFIPFIDYIVTVDNKSSGKKYEKLGANSIYCGFFPSKQVFLKKPVQKMYDVSFVGSNIADREEYISFLRSNGINIHTFGKDWNSKYLTTKEMVHIYNKSKINLNFVKSYHSSQKQIKARVFEICLSGGFLLTEHVDELTDYYTIGKDIDTFNTKEEAIAKINYYLKNDQKRDKIANAGYQKTKTFYSFEQSIHTLFSGIEKGTIQKNQCHRVVLSKKAVKNRYNWHFRAAYGWFQLGNFKQSKEQLNHAKKYGPNFNIKSLVLKIFNHLPAEFSTEKCKIILKYFIGILNLPTKARNHCFPKHINDI
jgi:hypothetical protein